MYIVQYTEAYPTIVSLTIYCNKVRLTVNVFAQSAAPQILCQCPFKAQYKIKKTGCVHLIHIRRIYTEEKAKVVGAVWETELVQFLSALAILHQDDLKNWMIFSQNRMISSQDRIISSQNRIISSQNRMMSSYSSNRPGAKQLQSGKE